MADLDDFFAKKDRKKSKGKKFATADEIAKKLEESGKRIEKPKKEKIMSSVGPDREDQNLGNQEEDEWKDFEEEKKDYTGLKIQNLNLNENDGGDEGIDDGEDGDSGEMEENEAGELVLKRKVQTGPWKVVAHPHQQQQQQQQVQPPVEDVSEKPIEKKLDESSTKTSGSYVPPHVRNLAQQPTHHHIGSRLKNKAAPDVNNEELFPTLSAAKSVEPSTGAWGRKI